MPFFEHVSLRVSPPRQRSSFSKKPASFVTTSALCEAVPLHTEEIASPGKERQVRNDSILVEPRSEITPRSFTGLLEAISFYPRVNERFSYRFRVLFLLILITLSACTQRGGGTVLAT